MMYLVKIKKNLPIIYIFIMNLPSYRITFSTLHPLQQQRLLYSVILIVYRVVVVIYYYVVYAYLYNTFV